MTVYNTQVSAPESTVFVLHDLTKLICNQCNDVFDINLKSLITQATRSHDFFRELTNKMSSFPPLVTFQFFTIKVHYINVIGFILHQSV